MSSFSLTEAAITRRTPSAILHAAGMGIPGNLQDYSRTLSLTHRLGSIADGYDRMAKKMPTPLQPKEFFTGVWKGEGELCPHPLLRWAVRKEHIHFEGRTISLSDKAWMVKERFEFSSGDVMAREMIVEMVGPDRLHVTADDMPLGADIFLHEKGFRFTPYHICPRYRGRRWRLRCADENLIDENGTIHDTIKMFLFGFPVATMRLAVTVDRT